MRSIERWTTPYQLYWSVVHGFNLRCEQFRAVARDPLRTGGQDGAATTFDGDEKWPRMTPR